MVTEGSVYLYEALDKKVYFKEATILVPSHWKSKNVTKARTESFEKAKIRIDNANSTYGDQPYTKQYGECGTMAEYIHFTPEYLLNDAVIQLYGLRGRVFVHEWAHLRWGVYDEYNKEKPFYHSNGRIEATRCSKNIEGQFYEVTAGGSLQPCHIDPQTSLPTDKCKFFPDRNQNTNSSLMSLPSLDSCLVKYLQLCREFWFQVSTFCRKNEHNNKAPNLQNEKCDNKATWTVIFEDSVDKDALQTLKPLESPPPPPSFKVVQRAQRVVCLILDVSGSMEGARILQQRQAATHFLRYIIEDQASVGIVTFSTSASTLRSLTIIDSNNTRETLVQLLPKRASGSTNMCLGLSQGLHVLQEDNGDVLGDEIIFLTDGLATDNIAGCAPSAIQSGAIISTIAFSNSAAQALTEMADKTGKFVIYSGEFLYYVLLDGFSSLTVPTGDQTKEPVQLDSVGAKTSDWFNGTVPVDQTVGTRTSFTITYETSLPNIYITSPSGSIYDQMRMRHDESTKTVTLKVPGIAETGDWKYSIKSPKLQSLTVTATSQAARADVPPIIVKANMDQKFNDGTKPMTVYAEVSQNYKPVINAEVWATLEPDSGSAETLQLLDNGAGTDAFKDDGVYSRYFTKMKNGRSSLKVRVKNQGGQTRFTLQKRGGAPYVPGYVVDGVVELNPSKPPVLAELFVIGSFTRTATGESFEVVLKSTTPPNFPPNRITDLSAEIQEDTVLLSWTAPGEDLDQGTAKYYKIMWSFDLKMLRFNFSNAHEVNISAISPQEAGSVEQHSFNLGFPIQNGTTLFFAVQSEDKELVKSEISNIAQASKILPLSQPTGVLEIDLKLVVIAVAVCLATVVIIAIIGITIWALTPRKTA
ncbi:calcium-activated chloride channel regulator 3A-1-like [Cyprinus carpio]|uniref:Calcium-activated chloride channel regulator 3A-1-like n=1 Tax=Cyprinus carpio TaxID=7962 RepID=A0A9Q9YWC9_CYPCA|nr:calcium-activated chloride channel regulator 3A-1-like [Cyprinus carpio]